MIDKFSASQTLKQAIGPLPTGGRAGAPDQAIAFAQTLKHPMETRGAPSETSTEAAERGHAAPAQEGPTEIRARLQPTPTRKHQPQPQAFRPQGQGTAPPAELTTPQRAQPVSLLRALGNAAAVAPPDMDVAALSKAVRLAVGRLTDTSAAAREAAGTKNISAAAEAAVRGAPARPGGPLPPPTNHAADRFEALLAQFSARSGDATTFRLIDGTAGTLEVKVALSGGSLHVHVRPEDAAMNATVAASLDELRKQLLAANIVASGDIHVSQENDRHDDAEHQQSQHSDSRQHDTTQGRTDRGHGRQE